MSERDWMDAYTDALARLGPRVASRALRAGWELMHALTGRRLQARVRFLDFSMFGGDFEASADAVRRRVPSVFEIIEHAPGRTLIAVQALDYRRVDVLTPYRELAITTPVRYRGEEGHLVLEMPVTTEVARWGGVEAYGFPKILADIRIHGDDGGQVCRVTAAGMSILTLRAEHAVTARGASLQVRHLNVRDDHRVIASRFDGGGEMGRSDAPGGATLELGEHAIAHGLRALEIETRSLAHVDAPRMSATLSKGEELGIVTPLAEAPERARPRWAEAARSST